MKELSIFSTNFFPEPPPRTEVSFFLTILYLNKKLLEQKKKVVHALVKKQKRAIYLAPYFLELHFDLGGRSITAAKSISFTGFSL